MTYGALCTNPKEEQKPYSCEDMETQQPYRKADDACSLGSVCPLIKACVNEDRGTWKEWWGKGRPTRGVTLVLCPEYRRIKRGRLKAAGGQWERAVLFLSRFAFDPFLTCVVTGVCSRPNLIAFFFPWVILCLQRT